MTLERHPKLDLIVLELFVNSEDIPWAVLFLILANKVLKQSGSTNLVVSVFEVMH